MSKDSPVKVISGNVLAAAIVNGKYKAENFINSENFVVINTYKIEGVFEYNASYIHQQRDGLVFKNCVFNDDSSFHNYSNIKQLTFDSCIFEGNVSMYSIQRQITFQNNCCFKKNIYLDSNGGKDLIIQDARLNGKMLLTGQFAGTTSIYDINTEVTKAGEIEFNGAIVNNLSVISLYISKILFINESTLKNESNFDKIKTDRFELNGMIIGLKFRLKNSEITDLILDNISGNRDIEITKCKVTGNANFAIHMLRNTLINDCPFINKILLWGKNNSENQFNMEKTTITTLEFDRIRNDGCITLREIKIDKAGALVMRSSILGKIDFILCNFSQAIWEFENSRITEAFFSETDFPYKVRWQNNINYAQAQLAFGQLHTAFQRQGDTVRALEYQSREIEAHYRKIKWFITKSKPYVSFTWLNLWLNKISNDFGRNWVRGLIFSVIIGVIFFYFLVLSTEEYHFGLPITFNTSLIKAFFKFMNPLRFFESEALFEQHLTLNEWSYFVDFFGRVFIAYGFYQTIQAFRRYGRK